MTGFDFMPLLTRIHLFPRLSLAPGTAFQCPQQQGLWHLTELVCAVNDTWWTHNPQCEWTVIPAWAGKAFNCAYFSLMLSNSNWHSCGFSWTTIPCLDNPTTYLLSFMVTHFFSPLQILLFPWTLYRFLIPHPRLS